MTTTQQQKTLNGLDTTQLFQTVAAIKDDPSLGRSQFRLTNQWIQGGENRSTIQGFYAAGREDDSRAEPFVFTNGEPPVLLGDNEGANPVEFLLHAMAGCFTTTTALHAAARGIHIRSMRTRVEGEIDLQGLLALSDDVPVGYQEVRIHMDIDADCSPEELEELLELTQARSPVCQSVCRPVPFKVDWTRA